MQVLRYFFIWAGVFTFWSLIMDMGNSAYLGAATTTAVNSSSGFAVDEISQGAGFIGVARVTVAFFTTTLPRWVLFDYSFLAGELEIVRYILMASFGIALVLTLAIGIFSNLTQFRNI